jgi:hypothetical protein
LQSLSRKKLTPCQETRDLQDVHASCKFFAFLAIIVARRIVFYLKIAASYEQQNGNDGKRETDQPTQQRIFNFANSNFCTPGHRSTSFFEHLASRQIRN